MSFEYSTRICPFWECSLKGRLRCSITEEFCSYNFAKDKFLDCIEYLTEVGRKVRNDELKP